MNRFKNILYYTDGTGDQQHALVRAMELAERNHARLTVLGVLERVPAKLQTLLSVTQPADWSAVVMQDFREELEALVKPVRSTQVRLNIEVLYGTPFVEIIRAVAAHRYDLVMLTAEGGGQTHPLLGSTSQHLMRKCPCPVWVIKQGPRRHFKRILVTVHPDTDDEEHQGVNAKIMEMAASLAKLEKSELSIVHAWNLLEEEALRHWHKHLPAAVVDRVVRETESQHGTWLNELVAAHRLAGISHSVHLLRGKPAEVIIDFAAGNGIDLIVMGTVGRTGIPGFLIGNTAETVLGQVQCSVLAVKPDDFVSPVK